MKNSQALPASREPGGLEEFGSDFRVGLWVFMGLKLYQGLGV